MTNFLNITINHGNSTIIHLNIKFKIANYKKNSYS